MTPAEELLLKLMLDGASSEKLGHIGPLADAARDVLLERCTPEALEKFGRLYARYRQASAEFYSYFDSLPAPVARHWYTQHENEAAALELAGAAVYLTRKVRT